jgi:chitinase
MNFDQIPVGSLDYLFFSFGYITPGPAFDIVPMDDLDPELFLKLTEVKRRNSKLKAMVALGGWTYNVSSVSLWNVSVY